MLSADLSNLSFPLCGEGLFSLPVIPVRFTNYTQITNITKIKFWFLKIPHDLMGEKTIKQ